MMAASRTWLQEPFLGDGINDVCDLPAEFVKQGDITMRAFRVVKLSVLMVAVVTTAGCVDGTGNNNGTARLPGAPAATATGGFNPQAPGQPPNPLATGNTGPAAPVTGLLAANGSNQPAVFTGGVSQPLPPLSRTDTTNSSAGLPPQLARIDQQITVAEQRERETFNAWLQASQALQAAKAAQGATRGGPASDAVNSAQARCDAAKKAHDDAAQAWTDLNILWTQTVQSLKQGG